MQEVLQLTLQEKHFSRIQQRFTQELVIIRELILAFREAREPIWTKIDDESIKEIARAQWFLSNPAIMWGFLHKSWDKIMEKHLKGSRKSSTRWLARLSNRIWEITEDQWKHRNDIEHGEDKENARSKQINTDMNIEIDRLFDSAPPLRQLPVTSRHFFGKGRKWRKNRKIRDKKKWIRDVKIVMQSFREIGPRIKKIQSIFWNNKEHGGTTRGQTRSGPRLD